MDNINTTHQNKDESAVEELNLPASRKKIIKIAIIAASVLVLLGLLFSVKSLFVAAIVDGQPISRFAVISELERQGGQDALDTLIDKRLIAAEAKAKGVTVASEAINAEMKKFDDQFSAGGQSLDDALEAENLTREDLREQLHVRLEIEQLIGDKANVSDEDLQKYITDAQVTIPEGQEEETRSGVRDQLRQQKLGELSGELITELRNKAKIRVFVPYYTEQTK